MRTYRAFGVNGNTGLFVSVEIDFIPTSIGLIANKFWFCCQNRFEKCIIVVCKPDIPVYIRVQSQCSIRYDLLEFEEQTVAV